MCVAVKLEYNFVILLAAAMFAASSVCDDVSCMCESVNVSTTVTSQASGVPLDQGIRSHLLVFYRRYVWVQLNPCLMGSVFVRWLGEWCRWSAHVFVVLLYFCDRKSLAILWGRPSFDKGRCVVHKVWLIVSGQLRLRSVRCPVWDQ